MALSFLRGVLSDPDYLRKEALNKYNPAPEDNIPDIDPRLGELQKQQAQQARSFREGLAGYQQGRFDIAQEQTASGIPGLERSLAAKQSKRGMLYGGVADRGFGNLRTSLATSLARQRFDINKAAEDEANALERSAIESGNNFQAMKEARNVAAYRRALERYQNQQNQLIGQGGTGLGGLGSMLGGIAGSKAGG